MVDQVSADVQDDAKAVYALEARHRSAVSTNDLAERLGVTPGSVSGMLRRLSELGLVEHEPYRGVRLTDRGRRVALEVPRHHRLIELFLVDELGMPWDQVHAEAEVLEHVLSEDLEQLISERLGNPTLDPHGDPIPSRALEIDEGDTRSLGALEIDEGDTRSLEDLAPGAVGRFVRVSDADPEMLRYLAEQGIALGTRLQVVGRQPFGGPAFVRAAGRELALGGQLVRTMRIELEGRREPWPDDLSPPASEASLR